MGSFTVFCLLCGGPTENPASHPGMHSMEEAEEYFGEDDADAIFELYHGMMKSGTDLWWQGNLTMLTEEGFLPNFYYEDYGHAYRDSTKRARDGPESVNCCPQNWGQFPNSGQKWGLVFHSCCADLLAKRCGDPKELFQKLYWRVEATTGTLLKGLDYGSASEHWGQFYEFISNPEVPILLSSPELPQSEGPVAQGSAVSLLGFDTNISVLIASMLDLRSLMNLSLVSRACLNVVRHPLVWKHQGDLLNQPEFIGTYAFFSANYYKIQSARRIDRMITEVLRIADSDGSPPCQQCMVTPEDTVCSQCGIRLCDKNCGKAFWADAEHFLSTRHPWRRHPVWNP